MRKGFEAITDFIFMNDKLVKADVILIPGSAHKELAVAAAKLYHEGYSNKIIPSGGFSKYLEEGKTEFEFLKQVLINEGVKPEDIIEESKAAHTFDNATLSLELMDKHHFKNAILVCKGYHSRRAYLTYRTVFPKGVTLSVHSIVGRYQISKDNWYMDQSKINKVMLEVEKIGKYFKEEIQIMNNKKRIGSD
jgi:uncharacterized SAM-binding protein YcdF (DUF218 family)